MCQFGFTTVESNSIEVAALATASTAPDVELTILMPCLNEAATLEGCIRQAQQFLQDHDVRGEVLIADNRSDDGSPVLAKRLGARVVSVPLRGYGAAIRAGSQAARGRFIAVGDADGSYDFSSLGPFLERLHAGYDLVLGNRFQGGIEPGAMPWKSRYLGNPVLSGIARLLFGCVVRDLHCGLRAYSKEAFIRMDLQTTGMELASEMPIRAVLLGMNATEVPTKLYPDGPNRRPHLRPWRDGWRHLTYIFRTWRTHRTQFTLMQLPHTVTTRTRTLDTSCKCLQVKLEKCKIAPRGTVPLFVNCDLSHGPHCTGSLGMTIRGYNFESAMATSVVLAVAVDPRSPFFKLPQ
jgi:hypothetical protein